jgi:predicted DNA-binding transcriptional regulator AlpA
MTDVVAEIELPERLWTHKETAEYLRVDPQTLYQFNSDGTGPRNFKVGRERRYDPRDVAVWLKSRASRPPETRA